MTENYSEDIQKSLKAIVDHFTSNDRSVRDRQIRLWKKLEFYWSGMTNIWWDDTAHDWRIYDTSTEVEDNQAAYYDKPINVFRAYLESIIAALSATVPEVECYPDDADNMNDLLTAKGGTKIGKLIYEHIDADLLFIKALYVFCTQGMVAAYNYSKEDKSYGTVTVPDYKEFEEVVRYTECPSCGKELAGEELALAEGFRDQLSDEFRPEVPNVISELEQESGGIACPSCQMQFNPNILEKKIINTRIVGETKQPKARQCIDINGGLFVNVPNWARRQEDCSYLEYAYETHYSNVLAKYPDLREKVGNSTAAFQTSDTEDYGRWGRLSPQYLGEYPQDTPTVRNWWLRPSAFEVEPDAEKRKQLYKKFPDGVKCVWVNDVFAEASPESLDDYWTLTYNPLSEYIHFDPLGLLLVSVQDITNELISLTLQTIEHGIPQTFADPKVLNFEQYRNSEVAPGAVFPAKAQGGKGIGDGFHTITTASLSAEVDPFAERINQLGQLASGALPTLFGGSLPSAQRTAAQYQMSRNQAMQRLQTTWKTFNSWWERVFGKVIPAYIKDMIDDERMVKKAGDNFTNIVIRRAELNGRIGSVHIEASDDLPKTWGQIRDMVMEILQLNNPEIMALLGAPENLDVLQKVFGPTGLKVPDEVDREKQYDEIQQLLRSEPMPSPMGGAIPTVEPDMLLDKHQVHAEICRQWLNGEAGRQAKIDNPMGYENVLAHFRVHVAMIQQEMMMMQPQVEPGMEEGENDSTSVN